MTGIRASTINDIYNEFAERISLNHLDRICKALNCDISDILEYIPMSHDNEEVKGVSDRK